MPCCDTGRNIQKYKGAAASTLQDVTDNGNTTTGDIITTSGYFIGDGSKLTNIPGVSGAAFNLEQVTAQGNWTSNTVDFQNTHTAFTTDLNSNVLVKIDQLYNVSITSPDDHKSLVYNSGTWIDDYIDFTSIEVKAGENLVKGDIVYVSGATGDTPIVHKANSSDPTKMPAIGVVMDGSINQNNNGHVVTFGVFSMPSLNPNFQVGEILYVSNTAVGELMNTVPFGNTDKIQNVGICVKSGGKILVTGVGRANDIPNAEIVTSQPSYIYVNSTGNELKKISASSLNTNVNTLQQVTDVSNTTSNTVQFTNTSTSIITSGNVIVGTNVYANEYYGDGTNLTGIALNSDLTDNVTRIGTLETDLTDNVTRIGTLETDLTDNVTRIGTLETDLTDNVTRIGTLETELTNNVIRIGTLETDLTDNVTRIGTLETDLTDNVTRIGTLETDLTDNVTRIGTLETDLTDNVIRIGTLETDLTDNVTRIGTLETDLTDNVTRIGTLETDLTNNVIRIGTLETDLTDNVTRIGTLETEIQPVNRGGTGLTSFASGDLIYANGTSSFTNIAASSSTQGYFLKNDNGVPTWADVSLVGSASPYSITAGSGLSGGNYNGSSAVTWTADFSVVASTSNLNSNVTRIGTLETDLTDNVTRIGTLETDLTDNVTRIGTLETDLTDNVTRIGTLETDLTDNVTRIGTLETDLTDNVTRIGTLETDLTDNVTRIDTLETDLTDNVTRIGTLETDLTDNVTRIGTLETDLTDNVTRISTLEGETQPVNRGGTGFTSYTIGDILYASGTTTLSNLSPGTSGQVLTSSGTGSAPTWTTVSGGSSPWSTLNSNVYYTSGNVGIGTTSPSYKLHVVGTSNFTDTMYLSGSAGTSGQVLTSSGSGAPTWTTIASSPWTTSGTNVYYTSGNVGIGTTNPNYKLHVVGTSNFTNAIYANGSAGTSGQVLTSSGTGGAPTWATVTGSGLSPWTLSGSDIYRSSGNVGIGTTTPAYPLDVKGDIRTTSENGFIGNGRYISGINVTSERGSTIINFGQQSSLTQSVNGSPL